MLCPKWKYDKRLKYGTCQKQLIPTYSHLFCVHVLDCRTPDSNAKRHTTWSELANLCRIPFRQQMTFKNCLESNKLKPHACRHLMTILLNYKPTKSEDRLFCESVVNSSIQSHPPMGFPFDLDNCLLTIDKTLMGAAWMDCFDRACMLAGVGQNSDGLEMLWALQMLR